MTRRIAKVWLWLDARFLDVADWACDGAAWCRHRAEKVMENL